MVPHDSLAHAPATRGLASSAALAGLLLASFATAASPVQRLGGEVDPRPGSPTPAIRPPLARRAWGGKLNRVYVLDRVNAWIAEDGGRIRRTMDGGLTWTAASVPPSVREALLGIHFLDDGLTGWAVGFGGRLITSSDGGQTWDVGPEISQSDQPSSPADLHDVYFLDATRGWVVGDGSLRYTTDGGASWNDATLLGGLTTRDYHLRAIEFSEVDGQFVGLAVGYQNEGASGPQNTRPGVILRTASDMNAGQEWDKILRDGQDIYWPDLQTWCPSKETVPSDRDVPLYLLDVEFFGLDDPGSIGEVDAIVVGKSTSKCGYVLRVENPFLPTPLIEEELNRCDEPHCPAPFCDDPTSCSPGQCNRPRRCLTRFTALYGVGVDDNGTEAVSAGYQGQVLRRIGQPCPLLDRWTDRTFRDDSTFPSPQPNFRQWATVPTLDASINKNDSSQTLVIAVGHYNMIERSLDGGACWDSMGDREAWRMDDVYVSRTDPDRAWFVGQWCRVSKTVNGLEGSQRWASARQNRRGSSQYLNAIAWDPSENHAVAVGEIQDRGAKGERMPSIFWWNTASWKALNVQQMVLPEADGKNLHDAEWVNGQFWAVGGTPDYSEALGPPAVLRTLDGMGREWEELQVVAEEEGVVLTAIAYDPSGDQAFAVGYLRIPGATTDTHEGRFYWIPNASNPGTANPVSVPAEVSQLRDVAALQTSAGLVIFVAGSKLGGSAGALYRVDASGTFTEVAAGLIGNRCFDGALLEQPGALNAVEIVRTPEGFQVFAAGRCGQILWSKNGARFQELDSQTSLELTGLALRYYADQEPAGVYGYATGQHQVSVIVKLSPK